MDIISARSNPLIKEARALSTKKGRTEQNCYLIEGSKLVKEAMDSLSVFRRIFVQKDYTPPDLSQAGTPVHTVTRELMSYICDTVSPQGLAAVVQIPEAAPPDYAALNGLVIALDDLRDPGNVGAIIRTADAAGAQAVILSPDCADLYNPKTIRATMGSVYHIPVYTDQALPQAIRAAKSSGYTVIASHLKGLDFYDYTCASDKQLLLIGSESHGLSDRLTLLSDVALKLPMRGKAESLNASVAAGIMIYGLIEKLPKA